jgi:hypothetical protein
MMPDWLDRIPNLGVPRVPGVPARFPAGFSGTPENLVGVPGVLEHKGGTPRTPTGTPEDLHKVLKHIEEHREHPEHRKVAGSADDSLWGRRIAPLGLNDAPSGFDLERWGTLLADARWLAEVHGETAAKLGWTASDLFGLDPQPGWGGLADRLDGARQVNLTDQLARWRSGAAIGWLRRLALRPMRTIWEVAANG